MNSQSLAIAAVVIAFVVAIIVNVVVFRVRGVGSISRGRLWTLLILLTISALAIVAGIWLLSS